MGSFPAGASPYGVLDMIGNVEEWTADWNDSEHKNRSVRGGSWKTWRGLFDAIYYHATAAPTERRTDLGFRCVQ